LTVCAWPVARTEEDTSSPQSAPDQSSKKEPSARGTAQPATQPATQPAAQPTASTEYVQVTATRLPESPETLPGALTVVTREDLMSRGARDLTSALALVAGVSIAPGGDSGPAGSVPELMGLREFDAFLLTVDGVPWGGTFIPALATLDLKDVDRIEVLRGAAPVMYGATSFVGVINIIRRTPGEGGIMATASGGSYGSGLLDLDSPLPSWGALHSSLDASMSTQGYKDDRAQVDRGILRWRGLRPAGKGTLNFNAGGIWQRQDPASPRVRDVDELTPLVPEDTNNNPLGSHLDENRYVVGGGYDHPLTKGTWATTLSVTRSNQDILRGFLTDITASVDNANGFRQKVEMTEIYFDSHVEIPLRKQLQIVAGLDHLHGAGNAQGGDFDYTVALDGGNPPDGNNIPNAGEMQTSDHREFSGLYGQAFWDPAERWHVELGLRLNRTSESRSTREEELVTATVSTGEDQRSDLRSGGVAGVTYTAWKEGSDALHLFADYRNTYKPAVVDFGPEAEPGILEPETGISYEGGVKGRLAGGRFHFVVTAYQMDLNNIVVSQSVGGLPALENAGEERLQGAEAETGYRIRPDLNWRVGYSYHNARFGDYVTAFDVGGVLTPTQLKGNRLEMSAKNMASMGLIYGRDEGWQAYAQSNYVGSRYLNKRNTALAPDYVTYDAGIGYRFKDYEVRLDGWNLSDRRDPVSESELGDAQYYILPARSIQVALRWTPSSKKAGT
jgi:outer membrane receptor protein involved in Fe transport